MKKKGLKSVMYSLVLLLVIPAVLADIGSTLGNVWQRFLSVGTLSFIGISGVLPLTRILIWIFIFTVIFATITSLKDRTPFSLFNRGQAGVIAAVVATISAVFIPAQVLLATGTGWAVVVALFLIGGPIVGLGYLLLTFPRDDAGKSIPDTKGTVLLKLVLCLLVFWILSAMKNAAGLS